MAALKQRRFIAESPPVKKPTKVGDGDEKMDLPPRPRYIPVLFIGSLCLAAYFFLLVYYAPKLDKQIVLSICISLAISLAAFGAVVSLVPVGARYLLRKGLFGYDINKKGSSAGSVKIPESLGLVAGVVFVVAAITSQHLLHPDWQLEYVAALFSVLFMLLLGFSDDVLDIPWRVKLFLPGVAAVSLLVAYAGHTTIVIPKPIRPFVGVDIYDLGYLYKLMMLLLAVFCTNSINILAGVNGLEVGQSVVLASAILTHNIMQIGASSIPDQQQAHLFSIYLMQPMVAVSLGLLAFNWFPSSVFVGDTYTYFAGMTIAVAGILGHFSETLCVFFLPQILNFLYSIPQLFHIVPCPRHRLPKFNPKTGLLTGSNDYNLVNLFLRWFGSTTEQKLCLRLLFFQVLCCGLCFALRYIFTGWYK